MPSLEESHLPFEGAIKKPDAQSKLAGFKSIPFTVEFTISLRDATIRQIGFESTSGDGAFKRILSRVSGEFVGQTKEEAESLSFEDCSQRLSLSPEEYEWGLFAWTGIQDAVAKLPSSDPFDMAVRKIARLNSEFSTPPSSAEFED
ncbi:MAG: hypothetical protein Q8P05_00370 [Candidatus Diapherotrites archaeon]|nr:hypothetical protein [Candidatus Diapherotrites archaeon]MDZ4256811.1 hypothetical protein [archaeon]